MRCNAHFWKGTTVIVKDILIPAQCANHVLHVTNEVKYWAVARSSEVNPGRLGKPTFPDINFLTSLRALANDCGRTRASSHVNANHVVIVCARDIQMALGSGIMHANVTGVSGLTWAL